MVRFTPLAALALVPLAQARFDWLYSRDTIAQCPPCSLGSESSDCSRTVTVTKPSGPYETVTVSDPNGAYHTVTVTEQYGPGKTVTITQNYQNPQTKVVYISQGETVEPAIETITITRPGKTVTVTATETETSEHIVTKKIDSYPGPKTVTISNGYAAPSAGSPDYNGGVVAKIVGGYGDYEKDPDNIYTVTVVKDGHIQTLTYTNVKYNTVIKTITQDNGREEVVTVTGNDQYEVTKTVNGNKVVETITAENTNNYVVTKTIQQGGKYYTVIVKPEPTVSTITKENGDRITTVVEADQTYTLTAPAKYGTYTVTDDDCETYTSTATYTGKPEVEVIVYDLETGDSTCTKEDGKPCNPGYDNGGDGSKGQYEDPTNTKGQDGSGYYNRNVPVYTKIRTYGNGDVYTEIHGAEPTGCESSAVSTSIATVYNTVIVTADASPSKSPTAERRAVDKVRSPLSVRW
ncbi:uncharacterized protein FSUBG_13166 [Fusarium subglutinans]|uniref:Uncharacterized protein n=1 Tax=Gibberella subglutinans TaxID=42677 RepID=A0A8H5P1J6_GIBSU|nr:uncharacterized protein FSUBG_13166 [Fusarium subglutinans]KAF5583255.1 hypothetical protein FSUBG_13166 [Fusarium subglutinans]